MKKFSLLAIFDVVTKSVPNFHVSLMQSVWLQHDQPRVPYALPQRPGIQFMGHVERRPGRRDSDT